jgi:hypothetical protein
MAVLLLNFYSETDTDILVAAGRHSPPAWVFSLLCPKACSSAGMNSEMEEEAVHARLRPLGGAAAHSGTDKRRTPPLVPALPYASHAGSVRPSQWGGCWAPSLRPVSGYSPEVSMPLGNVPQWSPWLAVGCSSFAKRESSFASRGGEQSWECIAPPPPQGLLGFSVMWF